MSIIEELIKRRQDIVARKIEITGAIAEHRDRHGIGTTPIALREEVQALDLELVGIKIILEAIGLSDGAIDRIKKGKIPKMAAFEDVLKTIVTTIGYLDTQLRNVRTEVGSFRDTLRVKDALAREACTFLNERRHEFVSHDSSCNCGLCRLDRAHERIEEHEKGRGQAAEYAKRGREFKKARQETGTV